MAIAVLPCRLRRFWMPVEFVMGNAQGGAGGKRDQSLSRHHHGMLSDQTPTSG